MSVEEIVEAEDVRTEALVHNLRTRYCADSVESCPIAGFERFVSVGNYELLPAATEGAARVKAGLLYLFSVEHEAVGDDPTQYSVQLVEGACIDTAAILDLKWCPRALGDTPPLLAQADADGQVVLYSLIASEVGATLESVAAATAGKGALALSLDWNNRVVPSDQPTLAVSAADGGLHLLAVAEAQLSPIRGWHAHDAEAWITAFNVWTPTTLYSGADDCIFKGWDTRVGGARPLFASNEHEMGVTVVASSPHSEHVLATGSYDEILRVWDDRNMREPVVRRRLGGGLWRLKWHPTDSASLLVACMHRGFNVVTVQDGNADNNENAANLTNRLTTALDARKLDMEVRAEYHQHRSLAYGCDWVYGDTGGAAGSSLVTSCSFYDKSVHVWRVTNQS